MKDWIRSCATFQLPGFDKGVIRSECFCGMAFVTEWQALVTSRLEVVTIGPICPIGPIKLDATLILRKFTKGFLQLVSMIAGESQLGPVLQNDAVLPVKPGLQFVNTIYAND